MDGLSHLVELRLDDRWHVMMIPWLFQGFCFVKVLCSWLGVSY
jgi:hypothetical protein